MKTRWLFSVIIVLSAFAVGFVAGSFRGGTDAVAQTKSSTQMSPERQKVYAEIEATFGFVPGFIQTMSDVSLADEWNTLKSVQMVPGPIPAKYRELLGLAVAAARGCEYCAYFHTQFAMLNGASQAEIEDAVHFAKSNVGWSTYLHGMQYPLEQFKLDVDRICQHIRDTQSAGK
jgi:AhpD family alkylhydroperoxidase